MDSITVEYIEETLTVDINKWAKLPSEKVQSVKITVNGLSTIRHASSIYWLYEENNNWIIGSGSVNYDYNPITELVINKKTGKQKERKIYFMPDMTIDKIKLGWWNFV